MNKAAEFLQDIKHKSVAVVGLGLTGLSVVRYLLSYNIQPVVYDSRASLVLNEEAQTLLNGLNIKLGPLSETAFAGYDYVIVSPGLSLKEPALAYAHSHIDNVFCDVELFARVNETPVIAVTGSNGKSTVVAWLQDFLNRLGKKAVACGNYGVPVLDVVDKDYDVYVVELSSFQLETTNSLVCEAATVLNVTEDHLDRYDSFADYSRAKNKIYRNTKLCLYNRDDFGTKPLIPHNNCHSFGLDASCDDVSCWQFNAETKDLLYRQQSVANLSEFNVAGDHNGLNALAVLALSQSLGIDVFQHMEQIKRFSGLPHRCQEVANINGIRFIDDSKATNIASTEAALIGIAEQKNIVLIAGGDAKGAELSELKSLIDNHVKKVIALGKDKAQFRDFLTSEQLTIVDDMDEAVQQAAKVAEAGDVVLLSPACASIDMFKNYQHRGDVFKQAVLQLNSEDLL